MPRIPKKLAALAAVPFMSAPLALAAQVPAVATGDQPANTVCAYQHNSTYNSTRSVCKIDKQIRGAHLRGPAFWYFKSPSTNYPGSQTGTWTMDIIDTRDDGKCANAKLMFRSRFTTTNETQWVDACGPGKTQPFTRELNDPTIDSKVAKRAGSYSIAVCVDHRRCTVVWKQDVNEVR